MISLYSPNCALHLRVVLTPESFASNAQVGKHSSSIPIIQTLNTRYQTPTISNRSSYRNKITTTMNSPRPSSEASTFVEPEHTSNTHLLEEFIVNPPSSSHKNSSSTPSPPSYTPLPTSIYNRIEIVRITILILNILVIAIHIFVGPETGRSLFSIMIPHRQLWS